MLCSVLSEMTVKTNVRSTVANRNNHSKAGLNVCAITPEATSSFKSRNRAVADIVAARNLPQRLVATFAALDRLFHLVRGEFGLRPHLHATRHGARSAFACLGVDQLTLKLGKAA